MKRPWGFSHYDHDETNKQQTEISALAVAETALTQLPAAVKRDYVPKNRTFGSKKLDVQKPFFYNSAIFVDVEDFGA